MKTIHAAARMGDPEAIRSCLAAGVAVDQLNREYGFTPLMIACRSTHAGLETLQCLLDAGADPNAFFESEWGKKPEDIGIHDQPDRRNYPPHLNPLICEVIEDISSEKFRFLMEHGMDIHVRCRDGDDPFHQAACAGREDLMEMLIAAGLPTGESVVSGKSTLRILARNRRFPIIAWLLNRGFDPAPLGWTPLHRAAAIGSLEEVGSLIAQGANPEERDLDGRTAFLLAVYAGDFEKAELLLASSADPQARGNKERHPAYYAIEDDQPQMLQWLLDHGLGTWNPDESPYTPLEHALNQEAVKCFRLLLEREDRKAPSPDFYNELMRDISRSETLVAMLAERGANPSLARREAVHAFIHLETVDDLEVTREQFETYRLHRFGTANPERVDNPFWNAMVRCGWDAIIASRHFGENQRQRTGPVWSQHRRGMSLTPLPDGRFIQIGGQVGDGWDKDFCFYNDVIIHDGKGGFEILAYPREVFPPTDHHSATLAGEWIYIIGNYGEIRDRLRRAEVYRFHIGSGVIEKVAVEGQPPGWIHGHQAVVEDGRIRISGGKILLQRSDGFDAPADHTGIYTLNLETHYWDWSNRPVRRPAPTEDITHPEL